MRFSSIRAIRTTTFASLREEGENAYLGVGAATGHTTSVQYLGSSTIAIETTAGTFATVVMAIVGIIEALAWRPALVYDISGRPIRSYRR